MISLVPDMEQESTCYRNLYQNLGELHKRKITSREYVKNGVQKWVHGTLP